MAENGRCRWPDEGAGKTRTMHAVSGMIQPASGEIAVGASVLRRGGRS